MSEQVITGLTLFFSKAVAIGRSVRSAMGVKARAVSWPLPTSH